MRIAIIGATGRTGREVVSQALGHGHHVVAIARRPERLDVAHERLTKVRADVRDIDTLRAALRGADAVIVVVGDAPARRIDTYSAGIANVMQAMAELDITRLAVMSAAGTFYRTDRHLSVAFRLLIATTYKGLYDDLERMEQRVMASGLDWTIVRAAGLTDGPLTGTYRVGETGRPLSGGQRISRADVAAFLLKAVTTDHWWRKAVTIAN